MQRVPEPGSQSQIYSSSSQRVKLPPFPNSWFCIGHERDFSQGRTYSMKFLGHDIIAYKTSKGKMVVMDAYCPHLGAHLGRGMRGKPNKVKNDCIECLYHNFTYNEEGECVKNALGVSQAKKARVRTWPIRVIHGLVFVYHHKNDQAPSWNIPDFVSDESQWTPVYCSYDKGHKLHPQEVLENSVDTLHFRALHAMDHVEQVVDGQGEGPVFHQTLSMGMMRMLPKALRFRSTISTVQECAYGLGLGMARVEVPAFNFKFIHIVTVTPIDEENSAFRFYLQLAHLESGLPHLLCRLLGSRFQSVFYKLLAKAIMPVLNIVNTQDVDVWSTKTFVERPILVEEDGAIHRYRNWCKQFYSEDQEPQEDSASALSEASVLNV